MKRSPIKGMSKKAQARARERRKLVERVRERGDCEARMLVPEVACGGTWHVHELIRRSQWVLGYLVESNTKLLCAQHHHWVHEHPMAAVDLGLLKRSGDRPDHE